MSKRSKDNGIHGFLFQQQPPEMPEGYYSGDKPNPNLRAFVDAHVAEKPYDPETDYYDVQAFDKAIETTKATAIYNMHTYWSKKPHDAIRQYVRHYTESSDLVLDPFCGSGGTALAALMEGRKAIAIDRSPAATFITKNYCTPVDTGQLSAAFEELKRSVKAEVDWLYETRCERCGGKATTAYTVYSQTFQCPRCLELVPLFDCIEVESTTSTGKPKTINVCPHCHKRGVPEEISTRSTQRGSVPVMVSYLCQGKCKPARGMRLHNDPDARKREYFERYDLGKLKEIESEPIPYRYPTDRMMHAPEDQECWGVKWRAGTSSFRSVDQLFSRRNLWALAAIKAAIGATSSSSKDSLLFALNAVVLNCSLMYRYRENLKGGFQAGTYYLPQEAQVINVWRAYEDKVRDLTSAMSASVWASTSVMISTQSATRLSTIASAGVDYIFTDPPYADKVQYGELNFVWECWLGLDTRWHNEEIIVNEVRGATEIEWADMMRQSMAECYRVLKPGRWLSLCYHDTSEGTWSLVQDIMAEAGFIVDRSESALFIDTQQKSYNQLTADKVNKRDLVINFRKPRIGEASDSFIKGDEDQATFRDKLHLVIREYLTAYPGASKDRIYDEVVSRMVRAGQMEAHNFDELLSQIAEPAAAEGSIGDKRWYLKETEITKVDAAESANEDASAAKVREFISRWMKDNPGADGVHYSDIFEHYVYTVEDKPRRALVDWLLDYFYKTDAGTYRLPESDEEESIKAEARASGTIRRVKHYIAHLQQGTAILDRDRPSDATLAEWIRHCKRSGLYEQGKLLYEKGGLNLDNLSEEAMVNVEEDYQVCTRMLARSGK